MATEFEKWWEHYQDQACVLPPGRGYKYIAEQAWHAAQRALLRTIAEPPCVPEVGDKIKFLGLCHPLSLGKVKEVTDVNKDTIPVIWVGTKSINEKGEEMFSSGILSEVEKVS